MYDGRYSPGPVVLSWGQFCPLEDIQQYLQRFLVLTPGSGRALLASGGQRLQMLLNILQATGEVTTMSNYLHCQWPKMLILLRVRNRHRRPRNERGNLWKHYRQGFFLFCGMFWFLFCDGSPVESFTLFYCCVVIVLPLSGGWVGVQG